MIAGWNGPAHRPETRTTCACPHAGGYFPRERAACAGDQGRQIIYWGWCDHQQARRRPSLSQNHAAALRDACDLIAGPQVRNVATLGGNVAHALPAADGTIALLALGATVMRSQGWSGFAKSPWRISFPVRVYPSSIRKRRF